MTIQFEQLLNLPDIRVLSFEMDEDRIKCDIESTCGSAICHQCGQRATQFFEHGEILTLRHLPICEREVMLYLHTKRYRCQHCSGGPTTTERGDWYDTDAGCTMAFARLLLRELVNSTLQDVADKHGVKYGRVRGLLIRSVKSEVEWEQFQHLKTLGLDEISLLKGHRDFVVIVSTRDAAGKPVTAGRARGAQERDR